MSSSYIRYPDCGFISKAPARRWDDGSIAGNGTQGVLAYCRTAEEELVLSHEALFLPLFPDHGYIPLKAHFDQIRQLVLEGNAEGAQKLIHKLKEDNNFPVYNTTDPFVGACALDILMETAAEPDDYARSTDFETGECSVVWQDGETAYKRCFFVSRALDIIVVRLHSLTGNKLNVSIGLREITYIQDPHPKARDIYSKTIDRCESKAFEGLLTHRMHFRKNWEGQPLHGCATVARVIARGGKSIIKGTRLSIEDADEMILLIRTLPERNGEAFSVDDLISYVENIRPDYQALLGDHAQIHGELFNRCRLQLSVPEAQQQATEALQAHSTVGNTSPALVEKAFAASRYGIISSTGKLPPLLQGVWTGTWKPRWSGDYTLNGNVPSMVAASLSGNHYECQETLMDYLDSLMDDFRRNAHELLGFRGPLIPWRSSTHGRTHYVSYLGHHVDFPGTYWFAGAGWYAHIYYDYYLHTGDKAFFQNRLKPFLLDAAAFYEDYLTLEADDKYILSPSSSPENESSPGIYLAPNATMDVAVIKQLLRTVLREKDKLGVDDKQIERWHSMLSKMPAYAIGANGALKEWIWPGIENNEEHRHASHLYPLYYEVDPEIAPSAELREACRVAIDQRMAFRRLEGGGDMAFGFTQMGMAAAYLGDTRLAYEAVEYLVNSYWSPAMVSQHNVHDVFNLDISGGLPAVIITMLVQSFVPEKQGEPWKILLLPCLPPQWPSGRLKGVRCRGGFELDITWRNGTLDHVGIKSLRGEPCMIIKGSMNRFLSLEKGAHCTLNSELV